MADLACPTSTALLDEVRQVGARCRELVASGAAAPLVPDLTHYFGTKTYVRQIVIPPGTVLEGLTHTHSTVLIILRGSIDIILSYGERKHMPQGTVSVAPPMTRRAVASHEGATVLTVHHTEDIDTSDPNRPGLMEDLAALLVQPEGESL